MTSRSGALTLEPMIALLFPAPQARRGGVRRCRDFIVGPLLTAVRPGDAAERGKPIALWPCAHDHPRPNSLSIRQRRPSPRGHISGSHRCSTTVFLFRFRRHGGLWFLPNCGVSQTGRNDRLPSVRAPTTRHGPVAVKDRWLSFGSAIGYQQKFALVTCDTAFIGITAFLYSTFYYTNV